MQIESVNPFIESVHELFETMLGTTVDRGKISVAKEPSMPREVTALVGMGGFFHGTVALAFPTNTAISVVNKLLGEDLRILDETVVDGVSEFVNIVGGSGKSEIYHS